MQFFVLFISIVMGLFVVGALANKDTSDQEAVQIRQPENVEYVMVFSNRGYAVKLNKYEDLNQCLKDSKKLYKIVHGYYDSIYAHYICVPVIKNSKND